MAAVEGHVLATLENSTLSALHDGALTELARGSLSLAIGDVGDDQVLIAIMGDLEFLLEARVKVLRQGASRISWPASGAEGSGYIVADLGGSEADRETFDAVLSSWTSFSGESMDAHKGQLVLIDENTGSVVAEVEGRIDGPVADGANEKDPVLVETDARGDLKIAPLRASYGQSNSRLIGGAETVSRGILFLAEKVGSSAQGAASRYTANNPPTDSPIKFSPTTQKGLQGAQSFTAKAVQLSGKTVGMLSNAAGAFGDRVGKATGIQSTPSGKPPSGIKGGINKGLIAFNTVWDSLDAGGRHVLASTSTAGTQAIGHRYGPEAGSAFQQAAGGVTNVALVYIDVRGIGKRALLKSAGKSAIRAKMPDGRVVELQPDNASPASSGAATPTWSEKEKA